MMSITRITDVGIWECVFILGGGVRFTPKILIIITTFARRKTAALSSAIRPTGYSAVRLAHLLWEQGVVSSNLTTPTTEKGHQIWDLVVFSFSGPSGACTCKGRETKKINTECSGLFLLNPSLQGSRATLWWVIYYPDISGHLLHNGGCPFLFSTPFWYPCFSIASIVTAQVKVKHSYTFLAMDGGLLFIFLFETYWISRFWIVMFFH